MLSYHPQQAAALGVCREAFLAAAGHGLLRGRWEVANLALGSELVLVSPIPYFGGRGLRAWAALSLIRAWWGAGSLQSCECCLKCGADVEFYSDEMRGGAGTDSGTKEDFRGGSEESQGFVFVI